LVPWRLGGSFVCCGSRGSPYVNIILFIQTEDTPNPATLKFLPGRAVMPKGTAEFRTREEAAHSPLAKRLLSIEGIEGVFFGHDFVSVTRRDGRDWIMLKPHVLGALMEHFTIGGPVIEGLEPEIAGDEESDPLVKQIKELIETRVRPAVANDGGDITFHGYREGIVYLHMRGACAGCPSSTATLRGGIERLLQHFLPEVQEVRPI
jgi:Fe-S cluster biogenesis protein NfuA